MCIRMVFFLFFLVFLVVLEENMILFDVVFGDVGKLVVMMFFLVVGLMVGCSN